MIDRIINLVEQRVIVPLLAFFLAFITLGVFTQVVLRYVFSTTFLWSEELSLYAFIWCVFWARPSACNGISISGLKCCLRRCRRGSPPCKS